MNSEFDELLGYELSGNEWNIILNKIGINIDKEINNDIIYILSSNDCNSEIKFFNYCLIPQTMNIIQNENRTIFIDKFIKRIYILNLKINSFNDINMDTLLNVQTNNKYSKYEVLVNNVPSTLSIIDEYSDKDLKPFLNSKDLKSDYLNETYDEYLSNVLPKTLNSNIQWILNIIEKQSEIENIIYENDNFIISKDSSMIGNEKDFTKTHYLAISKDITLRSIRDLKGKHINMLKEISNNGKKIISEIHGGNPNNIRTYFHYHPSVWVLHIHFDYHNTLNGYSNLSKCHKLSDVIQNLTLIDDYYQKISIEVDKNRK